MKTAMDSARMQEGEKFFLIRNLKDAGCGTFLIEKILALRENGDVRELLRLLAVQRVGLLKKLHAAQQRIDCLDYLADQLRHEQTIHLGRNQ